MATSLSKIYPRLDKICDATFIRKVIGTTKKDAVIFITENDECRRFFEEKEIEIDRHNEIVRNDILQFFQANNMPYEVAKFKAVIKEKVAKDKVRKKELEKVAIIEQYLREKEQAKKEAEDRARLGLGPKPVDNGPSTPSSSSSSAAAAGPAAGPTHVAPISMIAPLQQPPTAAAGDQVPQTSDAAAAAAAAAAQANSLGGDSSESSEETQMNLEDFCQMLKMVVDQGHILLGSHPLKSSQIEMNMELQKIVINPKVAPTITIKKTGS